MMSTNDFLDMNRHSVNLTNDYKQRTDFNEDVVLIDTIEAINKQKTTEEYVVLKFKEFMIIISLLIMFQNLGFFQIEHNQGVKEKSGNPIMHLKILFMSYQEKEKEMK